MSITAGVAGNVSKCDHWKTAIFFWCLCGVLAVLAGIAAFYESIPKPHIIPVGYGMASDEDRVRGLVFFNDGEPAYKIEAPKPTPLGDSSAILQFQEVDFSRLSKDGGMRCFPMSVREFDGRTEYSNLATKFALHGVDSLLVSFRYADSKRPQKLRYTTTCKIIWIKGELQVELAKKVEFDWWKL